MADAAALSGLTEKFPTISEEQAVKAYKVKIQRELEIHRVVQKYRYVIDENSLQQMVALEASKTSDHLLVEFGFDLDDLVLYVQKSNLIEKKELASYIKMFDMQKNADQQKMDKKCSVTEEMEARLMNEAKKHGPAQVKGNGTLTWDTFLSINKMTIQFVHEMTEDGKEEYAKKRRALLKEGKIDEYEQVVIEETGWSMECRNNMITVLYALFEITKETQSHTQRVYFNSEEKR